MASFILNIKGANQLPVSTTLTRIAHQLGKQCILQAPAKNYRYLIIAEQNFLKEKLALTANF